MSDQSRKVEFLRPAPTGNARGFESHAPADRHPDHSTSPQQKARAQELFLRGLLSADESATARASQGGFESLIGRSNLLPAVFLESGAAFSRATCLIRTSGVDFRGDPGSWSGTGFLVSPDILLTNQHVLNNRTVAQAGECIFNYQIGMDGRPQRTQSFRMRPDRLFLSSPAIGGLDFTFVWVDGEPGAEFGFARVDRDAFVVSLNEFANMIGHPQGRMKEVSLQENNVLWQDDTVVHYTSDTESGSSGASISNNNWSMFALHHATRESQVDGHRYLNEGIKFSAIATHLEQVWESGNDKSAMAREVLQLFNGIDEELGYFGAVGRPTGPEHGSDFEKVVTSYQGNEHDIDVGFWNVEWLTNDWPAKSSAVARVLHKMNLDVWALEESSPNAAKALAEEMQTIYDKNYLWAAAEPESADGKQSCTLIWNADTVDCRLEEWGQPVDTWLRSHSRQFEDLGLEAVHGKIFNRYPALFHITSRTSNGNLPAFDFYLVALHLKARGEGRLRRQMASRILAAAVKQKIAEGNDADWILGGDFNAELATADFDALIEGGMVPVSAEDEENAAFTYLKGPKSLIDHIFLSPNLAKRYNAGDFAIVATERTIPDYVRDVSDHRPVLLRMSQGVAVPVPPPGEPANTEAGDPPEITKLKELLQTASGSVDGEAASDRLDRRRSRTTSGHHLSNRPGYDESFLGPADLQVPCPALSSTQLSDAAIVESSLSGISRHLLHYMHFSVCPNATRRFPFYAICNIDGSQLRQVPRADDWRFDPRIPESLQAGNHIYKRNDLDRGHMVRRLDPVWGTRTVAEIANRDTFYYTNACPQHKDLNQKEWVELEDYVLGNTNNRDLKVSVITGPVLSSKDRPYRGILIPAEFWKVVAMKRADTGRLSVTGYILTQTDLITGFEFVFGQFKTYQVALSDIEHRTGLNFGDLRNYDPKARTEGGFESVKQPTLIRGADSLELN